MKSWRRDATDGQIMVLFALLLAVLMGMAGLAIDVAHARSVAEDAQRAADAGALAGVVYLPADIAKARTQAGALTSANGFTDTSAGGACPGTAGAVCISYMPDAPHRILGETITVRVQTSFLRVLGLGTITVVRTARATYDDPIALGAPDHMLGFAPFPTKAIQSSKPFGQGFYLELRGPYTGLEHGDAFSPYFANINGDQLLSSSDTAGTSGFAGDGSKLDESTCAAYLPSTATTACGPAGSKVNLVNNPYYNGQNSSNPGQRGYNYIISVPPMPQPVLIKVLDPYDECNYSSTYSGTTVYGPDGKGGAQGESSKALDQCDAPYFNTFSPTSLKFVVYQPAARAADNTLPIAPNAAGTASDPTGANAWTVTVGTGYAAQGYQQFGADPASSAGTAHGFQWFTLGQVQNTSNQTEYLRVSVESVQNTDGSFGQGGNNFALAVCKTDSSTVHIGDPTQSAEWMAAATAGSTTDPQGTATSYDQGCADPNVQHASDGYGCPTAGDSTCYHVNAREAFCLETLQRTAGPAFIPIAQIDSHFAGATITVRLYDAGDIGGGTNAINILSPSDDPVSYIGAGNGGSNINGGQPIHLDLSAPAHSGYSPAGQGRKPMGWWGSSGKYPSTSTPTNCPADYNAYDHPNGDGLVCPPLNMPGINSGIYTANNSFSTRPGGKPDSNIFGNDTWLNMHVTIPSNYNPSVTNEWWKVYYNLTGSGANDTTTWQVVSDAAPVHLITGQ